MSDHEEEEKKLPQSKRIFINHVDSFHGRNLVEYLSQCVVGASLEDLEEEEEEEEEIEEDVDRHKKQKEKEGVYQIVGTMKDHSKPPPNSVKEIIQNNSREILYGQIVDCDIVIYDITEDEDQIDEAVWAVSQLHSDIDKFDDDKHRMFILLSTVMTWARSQPIDPEDVEIPFTEDDYRRRKPHPNFKDHISAEKTIIKLGKTSKSRLVTYVVAVGLTYGAGENIFHYLFKDGWHNNPELSCYGDGRNIVPTIHVRDLAAVIQNVADSRPKCRYIVAVDDSKNTLREIVKSVSKILTTGKVKKIPKEEVLLNKEIQQRDFDMLLVNLRMDSVFIKENMNIKWMSESGIVENIESITREYKETRKLQPIRVFLTGPPASGKTTVVEQLCKHFKLHHIKIKDVITESITKMEKFIADYEAAQRKKEEEKPEEEEEDEEDEDDSEDGNLDTYRELLESIRESREQNHGRIDDQLIIQLYHEKLLSKPCQNQGFILDGFPKLIDQAKELFDAGDEESEKEEGKVHYNRNLMPHLIVCLQATDNFLHERIINLPESVIVGTHNTEDGFTRRLAEYRAVNTEDETVLNYFDELEFHPEIIDIVEDSSLKMKETVEKIIKLMPQPRNYGPTPVEKEEIMRIETEKKLKKEEKEKEEKEKQEAEERELRAQRQCEWANRLEQVRNEEKELLEAKSVPLRNYLMKHVMPTLTKGLMECCKVRPDDAVDYLAEYMFKNNPQVE